MSMFSISLIDCFRRSLMTLIIISMAITLCAQFGGGQGTEDEPWQIGTPQHLADISNYLGEQHANKFFILTNNIDLDVEPFNQGEGWTPIGTYQVNFYGKFNGAGHVIDGLFINRDGSHYQGLFGCTREAVISNLGVTNATINGRNHTGGVVGLNRNSRIENCFSSGHITGATNTGGLVGYNVGGSVVINSYSRAYARTGAQAVGGLIGYSHTSTVTNCYSTGRVIGDNRAGGLMGQIFDTAVTNCYWDTQASELNNSAAGTGRTTQQMVHPYQNPQIVYVNWDFENVWNHDDTGEINNGYPVLSYQEPPPEISVPDITFDTTVIDNVVFFRIMWEPVNDAVSYKIFAADDPYSEDWGEPVRIVAADVTQFLFPMDELRMKYFYVVASIEDVP